MDLQWEDHQWQARLQWEEWEHHPWEGHQWEVRRQEGWLHHHQDQPSQEQAWGQAMNLQPPLGLQPMCRQGELLDTTHLWTTACQGLCPANHSSRADKMLTQPSS